MRTNHRHWSIKIHTRVISSRTHMVKICLTHTFMRIICTINFKKKKGMFFTLIYGSRFQFLTDSRKIHSYIVLSRKMKVFKPYLRIFVVLILNIDQIRHHIRTSDFIIFTFCQSSVKGMLIREKRTKKGSTQITDYRHRWQSRRVLYALLFSHFVIPKSRRYVPH